MKGRQIPYSEAELLWIKGHRDLPRRETHAAFVERFNRPDVSMGNYAALCKRKGWLTGRTGCFEKGIVPHNKGKAMPFNAASAATRFKPGARQGVAVKLYQPIGTERTTRDGYVERKVNDDFPARRRWKAVHLIRWEAAHGPVPDGHALKCLDGDRSNTDPTNWVAIPRALLPRLAGGRWGRMAYDSAPDELKPTLLAIAKLDHATREAKAAHLTLTQQEARHG